MNIRFRSALVVLALLVGWVFNPVLESYAQIPEDVGYNVIWSSLPANYNKVNLYGMAYSTDPHGKADYLLVVGSYEHQDGSTVTGFVYDHFGYIDPAQPQRVWEVEDLVGQLPEGTSTALRGVNSQGLLSGNMQAVDGPRVAFFIDLAADSVLTTIPIPGFAPANSRHYQTINELGDILFLSEVTPGQKSPYLYNAYSDTYIQIPEVFRSNSVWLNSSRQLVGHQGTSVFDDIVVRHTVGVGSETFNSLSAPSGINENGQVFAMEIVDRGRNKGDYGVRIDADGQVVPLFFAKEFLTIGIGAPNNSGDVIRPFRDGRDYYGIYHEGNPQDDNDGQLYNNIKSLITNDSDIDLKFRNSHLLVDSYRPNPILSERDSSGLGWVAGLSVQGINPDGTNRLELYILKPTIITGDPEISVSPTTGLTTTETGGVDSFDVVLAAEPTANVTIGISSSNTAEGTVDKGSLTFTPADWNQSQKVTISGVDDTVEDSDVAYTIVTAAATSIDPDYNGLDADDVSVTNEDDDGLPGGGSETYSSADTPLAIPDNNSDGVSSLITGVADHDPIALTVTLNINHQRPSDLDAFVTGPDGTQVQLFNVTGDNDLTGLITDTDGPWLIEVFDGRKKKVGTLNSWSITIDY